jgi:hypothetical protein
VPGGRDVSKNIEELEQANKKKPPEKRRTHRQNIAIGYAQARKAGNKKA